MASKWQKLVPVVSVIPTAIVASGNIMNKFMRDKILIESAILMKKIPKNKILISYQNFVIPVREDYLPNDILLLRRIL